MDNVDWAGVIGVAAAIALGALVIFVGFPVLTGAAEML